MKRQRKVKVKMALTLETACASILSVSWFLLFGFPTVTVIDNFLARNSPPCAVFGHKRSVRLISRRRAVSAICWRLVEPVALTSFFQNFKNKCVTYLPLITSLSKLSTSNRNRAAFVVDYVMMWNIWTLFAITFGWARLSCVVTGQCVPYLCVNRWSFKCLNDLRGTIRYVIR